MDSNQFFYKILLLGDSSVGKTCFSLYYTENTFQEYFLSSIGLDRRFKDVTLKNGNVVKIQIWDTAGQDRFHAITRNYFKGAHGIILIYDITKRETFGNVENWINQIKEEVSDKVCIILVGNKIDLEQKRVVSTEEGKKMAEQFDLMFFECSCKTGVNINDAFQELVEKTVENYSKIDDLREGNMINNKQNKKKKCC